MKRNSSIDHFTSKEQVALHGIRSRIVDHINPLLIYCYSANANHTIARHYFAKENRKAEWTFSCALLVIMPDEEKTPPNAMAEIKAITEHIGAVNILIQPLSSFLYHLKEGNTFFCWVQQAAIMLYENSNITEKLPRVSPWRLEWQTVARQCYEADPTMSWYMGSKIRPEHLVTEHTQEAEKAANSKSVHIKVTNPDGSKYSFTV